MAEIQIDKTWTDLADDYCFESFNKLGEDIMNNMSLTTDQDFTFINRGSTIPSGANQAYLWFNSNDQKLYEYIGGVWVSRHPVPVGSNEVRMWKGTEADLWSYDGGDGTDPSVPGNVSDAAGSFWEVDTDLSARIPLGVGTLPGGTNINAGSTGGTDEVTLVGNNLPAHTHALKYTLLGSIAGGTAYAHPDVYPTPGGTDTTGTNSTTGAAVSIMNPYYGVYFIKRTARIYYTSAGTSGAVSAGGGLYFGSGAPSFTPVEGYGVYFDYTTRDQYIWSTTTSSWTL